MKPAAIFVSLLLANLAAALCTGCAQPGSRGEPSPTPAPQEPTSRQHPVDLGYSTEMFAQFAAADTLVLRLDRLTRARGPRWQEFKLKRPDCYHVTRQFFNRQTREISNGVTTWTVDRARKQYSQAPAARGKPVEFGLLPDLFCRAPQVLAGQDAYSEVLADARHLETEVIGQEPCDLLELSLHEPGSTALIWLAQRHHLPVRMRLVSQAGSVEYEVRTLELGARLGDALFVFAPGRDWVRQTGAPPLRRSTPGSRPSTEANAKQHNEKQ